MSPAGVHRDSIGWLVKTITARAGLKNIAATSGHNFRSGCVTECARNGLPTYLIRRHTELSRPKCSTAVSDSEKCSRRTPRPAWASRTLTNQNLVREFLGLNFSYRQDQVLERPVLKPAPSLPSFRENPKATGRVRVLLRFPPSLLPSLPQPSSRLALHSKPANSPNRKENHVRLSRPPQRPPRRKELKSPSPGSTGPVLGPFLGVHLTRDEVRVATTCKEFALQRVGDWIYYSGALYADAEIVAEDQIGPRRRSRITVFDPFLSDLSLEDLG